MTFEQEIVFKFSLAILCGGIIGFEREKRKKMGGFRTHILIALGSALVMMVSQYGVFELDPARLAAQVVSGVGFLGTGTILRDKGGISGLTTAASLWVTAGIGLAVGHEFYFGAIAATCAVMFSLAPLSFFSNRAARSSTRLLIEAENRRGLINEITKIYVAYEIDIHDIRFKHIEQEDISNLLITIVSETIFPEDIDSIVQAIESIKSVEQSKIII